MRFYSVHRTSSDGSLGYEWFTTKREAEKIAAEWVRENKGDLDTVQLTPVEIRATKRGILQALRTHASHPDNG
jgi:hypothetical protein